MSAAPLSFGQRLGYGIGDGGFNLFFTTAGLYLLYYYTDVLGLSPAAAGWVFAAALIWDAIFDPLMGYLANRTRTRWGRYRPYLLFGSVPLAASWALIFLPTGLTGTALLIFALATHMLFRTLYAVVNMPYLALTAEITSDSAERGVLAGFRMACAASCGLFAAFSTLKLVAAFGGGQPGFLRVALLYGVIACATFVAVFATTRETVRAGAAAPEPRLGDMLRMLRRNRAFWLVAGAMLAASLGSTLFGKTLPYAFKYALHREDLIGAALAASTGAVALSIPVWTAVMKRSSKRRMWMAGLLVSLVAQGALWFAPQAPAMWLTLIALAGFGAGAGYLGFWGAVPDTIEYGEWRSGVRAEGAVFGVVVLVQKAALGLAAAALGELLEAAGYRANQPQTAETLASMKLILLALPFAFTLATLIVIAFYPIDHQLHRRLTRALAWRRGRRPAADRLEEPQSLQPRA